MKAILQIVIAVVINRIYHKSFEVVYLSFGSVIREWAACLLISCLIVEGVYEFLG